MKKTAFTAFFIHIAVLLCLSASAASYTDDMDGFVSDPVKQYMGLVAHSFGRGASVVPDATAATFSASGGRLMAFAGYSATGATSVTAAIYSHSGTFVCRDPENANAYMMGVFRENMDSALSGGLQQALYSAQTNAVYTHEGGLKQMYTDMNAYYFGNVITPPSGELIGYGVNIYYSFDNRSFIRAQARITGLKFDTSNGYCYERYTAAVPEAAKYILVEINDVAGVPLAGGGVHIKEKKLQTALASVTITGDRLVMGEPEAIIEGMLPDFSQSAGGNHYSASRSQASRKEDSGETSSETEESAKAASGSKEASSKFEGTITSSQSSRSSRASSTVKKGGSEASEPSSSETSSQIETPPDETIVYDMRRATEKSGFNSGITAYIIIVSGVILALAVLPKRK